MLAGLPWRALGVRMGAARKVGGSAVLIDAGRLGGAAHRLYPPLPVPETVQRAMEAAFPAVRLVARPGAQDMMQVLATADAVHFHGHGTVRGTVASLLLPSAKEEDPPYHFGSWDLAGLRPGRLSLAVISACHGGAGGGDPWNPRGLVRALKAAGAKNVLANEWSVDSLAGSRFFERFYGQMARGMDVADAVESAAAGLRSHPDTSHPYYWAGWRIY